MTVEEQKQEEETVKTNPEVTQFWERITQEASTNSLKDFEELIKSDEFSYNGVTYRFVPVNWKNKPVVEKLRTESSTIDQDKDWTNMPTMLNKEPLS